MSSKGGMNVDDWNGQPRGTSNWLRHFMVMAVLFSINHGCVVAVSGLASADFGVSIAAVANGILYFMYTFSSLLLAVPLVEIYGPKKVLALGLWMYCFYLLAFGIIVASPDMSDGIKYVIVIVGSTMGGVGAGGLWSAQGAYFANAAAQYSKETGEKPEKVNGTFGGYFAFVFVGTEIIMKVLSSVIRDVWDSYNATIFVFWFYVVASALASIGIMFVKALPKKELSIEDNAGPRPSFGKLMCKKLMGMRTILTNPRIWLLSPLNLAFTYAVSYVANEFSGVIGPALAGEDNVGYLTAIIPGTAMILSIPFARLARYIGNAPIMWLGCFAFFIIGVLGYALDTKEFVYKSDTGKMVSVMGPALNLGELIVLYMVFGIGRAVYESTNKAVYADFFPTDRAGAFGLVAFESGLFGAVGFLLFASFLDVSITTITLVQIVVAGLSVITVPAAFLYHGARKQYKMRNGDDGGRAKLLSNRV